MTTKPQSTTEETWRSDKAHEAICEAAELIANQYCSEDDTYSLEVRRLTVAISDVVDQRLSPASAAPAVDEPYKLQKCVYSKDVMEALANAFDSMKGQTLPV